MFLHKLHESPNISSTCESKLNWENATPEIDVTQSTRGKTYQSVGVVGTKTLCDCAAGLWITDTTQVRPVIRLLSENLHLLVTFVILTDKSDTASRRRVKMRSFYLIGSLPGRRSNRFITIGV